MTCDLCKMRGKTWEGDDPKCAFESHVFSSDNWACETMLRLRELAPLPAYSEDQYAGIVALPDAAFIVLGWYKRRGRIEYAGYLDTDGMHELNLSGAMDALRFHGRAEL